MPSATPDIACFVGSPYLGGDGRWHCEGDTVPRATNAQLQKMSLPPFIKMSMMMPAIKVEPISAAPSAIDIKNCRKHQAPPNYTYMWNGSTCVLVALADLPKYLQQQAAGTPTTGSGAGSSLGDLGGGVAGITNFFSAHPFLSLGLVAGAVYMFAGQGMKPKSREVVSTTKY